jgi:hypothetical protein
MPQATENPTVHEIPIGLESAAQSSNTRYEFDSMGGALRISYSSHCNTTTSAICRPVRTMCICKT